VTFSPDPIEADDPMELPDRVVMRRRFLVEIVWTQPADQAEAEDWGVTLTEGIGVSGTALYDLAEGPLEVLGGKSHA
jgi:hypothetical protein